MTRLFPQMKQADPDTPRYAVLFCRLETCVAERAGMANGNSWQATMHGAGAAHWRRMALDACAGDEKPLHALSCRLR